MHLGIDLGTTNTLVSYVNENGNICRLEFQNGRTENKCLLPSCLAFRDGAVLIGQPALNEGRNGDIQVVRNTKYYMGRDDKEWMLGRKAYHAKDIATLLLGEVMRELKRQFPGESSFYAMVTVPARFDTQPPRRETKEALASAGFEFDNENVLMDEPVAAAVAYSRTLGNSQNVLVVDIGGGTFDLSLLRSEIVGFAARENSLVPVAWGGDKRLGGNDADEIILGIILDYIENEKNIFFDASRRTDPEAYYDKERSGALSVLLENMEMIKKQLYDPESEGADIYISDLFEDYDLEMNITREEYIKAAQAFSDGMTKCIEELEGCNEEAFRNIDRVLVVGGMAHEICLLKILEEKFGKDKLIIPEDSLYLVARGAAVCNSNISMHITSKAFSSIGVLTKSNTCVDVIIREGEEITPGFRRERRYNPAFDKATGLNVRVVEFKGDFDLRTCSTVLNTNLALNQRLNAKDQIIHTVFELNKDNLLTVSFTQLDGKRTDAHIRV